MQKVDLLSFGVPEENVDALRQALFEEKNRNIKQELSRRELNAIEDEKNNIRKAINSILVLIDDSEALATILNYCTSKYYYYSGTGANADAKNNNQQRKLAGNSNSKESASANN